MNRLNLKFIKMEPIFKKCCNCKLMQIDKSKVFGYSCAKDGHAIVNLFNRCESHKFKINENIVKNE
jgi:hypothetical protein